VQLTEVLVKGKINYFFIKKKEKKNDFADSETTET
jgi:hypothetical protein